MFSALRSWFSGLRSRPAVVAAANSSATVAAGGGDVSSAGLAQVGPRALALILEFEGLDQPWKRPPGDSGITIGHGFDLGYCSRTEFDEAWRRHLTAADLAALRAVIGLKGARAEAVADGLKRVRPITRGMADEVFARCTLPKWQRTTARTFPGVEVLGPDQQGVLVSLTFNRGGSLSPEDQRRREMRSIAATLRGSKPAKDKAWLVARDILAMRRLWPSDDPKSGHRGLRRRRLAEAMLMDPHCQD